MAPRFDPLGTLGSGMGNYFRFNFGGFPVGIPTYTSGVKAGLAPSQAFGASILTTAAFSHAGNRALVGRNREQRAKAFEFQPLDTAYQYSIESLLGNQGKKAYKYDDYLTNAERNRTPENQLLSEDEFENWRDREKQGWIFRYDEPGQSEIKGRGTLNLFGRTFANPYDAPEIRSALGDEGVDTLTKGTAAVTLGTSAATLANMAPKAGSSLSGLQVARGVGGSVLRGLGVGGSILAGVADYSESIQAGDSKFRAGVNAASSTTGSLAAASTAATLSAPLLGLGPLGWIGYAGIVGTAAIAGQFAGGYTSDRVLDLAGEGKAPPPTDPTATSAFNRYHEQTLGGIDGNTFGDDFKTMSTSKTKSKSTKSDSSETKRYSGTRSPEELMVIDREKIAASQLVGLDQNRISGIVGLDRNVRYQQSANYKTYADYQKDIYGINVKSSDTRYGIDTEDKTKRYLGIENIRSDERLGMTKIKTIDETDRWKYSNVDATKKYMHDNPDATTVARAKIAASPEDYMSQDTLSRKVNDQRRLFNEAKDQQYLENQLKVAAFNARYGQTNMDRLQAGVDTFNAQQAEIAAEQRKRSDIERQRIDESKRYESQRRDAIAQRADAMRLYQEQRRDKQNQQSEDRSRYAAERQDYYGQRAYAQWERQQDRFADEKRYQERRQDSHQQDTASRSLQKEQFELAKAKFEEELDLKRQDFVFRQQQYLDRRGDMNAANATAAEARRAIGAGYGNTYNSGTNVKLSSFSNSSSRLTASLGSNTTGRRNLAAMLSSSSW